MHRLLILLLIPLAAACGQILVGDDTPVDPPVDSGVDELPGLAVQPSCSTSDTDAVAALRCYTCNNACKDALPTYCVGAWVAPEVSCLERDPSTTRPSTVYRWYEADSDNVTAHQSYLRPFVLLNYMRKLRNAANASDAYAHVLEDQVGYILGHSKTYVADAAGPRSTVWQSYYLRPADQSARAYADGLNQAGYAFFFLSLARQYGTANTAMRDRYIELAINADNAMVRTYGNKTGGTLRVNAATCGATGLTGPCWYIHSRAPSNQWAPGTALNQSLYTARIATDLLGEALAGSSWDGNWPANPAFDREAWRERLRDRIANTMNQWAYGTGNTAAAPDAPPNLGQHMRLKGTTNRYHWADYEFDMGAHHAIEVGTHDHMCNYHTVTVNNLGVLLRNLDKNADGANTPGAAYPVLGVGPRTDRIMKAGSMLATYTSGGIIEATGATSAHPLYQWFVSELNPAYRITQEHCPAAGTGGTEALLPEAKSYLCRRFGGANNPAIANACVGS